MQADFAGHDPNHGDIEAGPAFATHQWPGSAHQLQNLALDQTKIKFFDFSMIPLCSEFTDTAA